MRPCALSCSGLRCWGLFCDIILATPGRHLPPKVTALVQWSNFFTSEGTYRNYLNAVAFGTELAGFDSVAVRHPAVKGAKLALKNREASHRPKHFITFGLLTKLVGLALKEDDRVSAMIYVIAYACLLRVPSECLPLVAGVRACTVQALNGSHSCLAVSETEGLVVTLARRKNRPAGARLVRSCLCFHERSARPGHAVCQVLLVLP